ncbi:MAG TPA: DUF262 domain-containing protein [Solirubrobacterales bacterium]|nr:DUF262 domain-containing protein [Solirubrobacterales bacterium]
MDRNATARTIGELQREFARIEFPEYQREPTVWSREQKQRLLDSILRDFDIAAIYVYEREDRGWECIDGRQRLNAMMSFLGENKDDPDNAFPLRIQNEVADDEDGALRDLEGLTYDELSENDKNKVTNYRVTTIVLSGSHEPWEFNLQFLRLNLGTLINAGEKLHAMVGVMRDLLFESPQLGQHPFLSRVRVPTRRYARELIAAQLMLQVSAKDETGDFARARHFDLQRYVKVHADIADPHVEEVTATLDALQESAPDLSEKLGNRAICVSVIVAAWALEVRGNPDGAREFGEFVEVFLDRLSGQVEKMKEFNPDPRYHYLVEFQRHLTQAAVEKPAIAYRHEILMREFEAWRENRQLTEET